jgi:hypothetical protein
LLETGLCACKEGAFYCLSSCYFGDGGSRELFAQAGLKL